MTDTINVHAQFSGDAAYVIEEIIRRGRAANRTEAIRIALLEYQEHQLSNEDELDRLAVKKMQQMEKEVKEGRRKVLSEDEVLKKYQHLHDV